MLKVTIYCFAPVSWYVGLQHLLQKKTQERFAPEALNLIM